MYRYTTFVGMPFFGAVHLFLVPTVFLILARIIYFNFSARTCLPHVQKKSELFSFFSLLDLHSLGWKNKDKARPYFILLSTLNVKTRLLWQIRKLYLNVWYRLFKGPSNKHIFPLDIIFLFSVGPCHKIMTILHMKISLIIVNMFLELQWC